MVRLLNRFLRQEEGVTAIEYALIASFIALVVAVAVASIGTSLSGFFSKLDNCLSALTVAACS